MSISKPLTRKFYIIFQESTYPWWRWVLEPGYGHVQLIINDGYNWIKMNPGLNTMGIKILPSPPSIDILDLELNEDIGMDDSTVLEVTTETTEVFVFAPIIRWMTCTLFVRYMIGVNIRGFTPYKLYKKLQKIEKSGKVRIIGKNKILSVKTIQSFD